MSTYQTMPWNTTATITATATATDTTTDAASVGTAAAAAVVRMEYSRNRDIYDATCLTPAASAQSWVI